MKNHQKKTEEQRMLDGMPPDVKEFYLNFKKNNPGKENQYYRAFVELQIEKNQNLLKQERDHKILEAQLAMLMHMSFSRRSN